MTEVQALYNWSVSVLDLHPCRWKGQEDFAIELKLNQWNGECFKNVVQISEAVTDKWKWFEGTSKTKSLYVLEL